MSNIYAELARLNLNTEQKTLLIYYFTENGEAEAKAEKAFTACNNDEEKHAYLNLVLESFRKNPELSEKSRSTEIESVDFVNDDKISEPHLETEFAEKLTLKDTSKEPVLGRFTLKDADLERFAQNLDLEQLKHFGPIKDIEKFYEFVGPDFTWPPTSETCERRIIFDYITDPDDSFEEGEGEELATNTIAYRRLIESGKLDPSQGSHIHLINGKIARYGSEISWQEYDKLSRQNPGMFYAPIVEEEPVFIRYPRLNL